MGSDLYEETRAIKARVSAAKKKPKRKPVGVTPRAETAAIAAARAKRVAEQQRLAAARARVNEVRGRLLAEQRRGRDLAYETLAAKSRRLYRELDGAYPGDERGRTERTITLPRTDMTMRSENRAHEAIIAARKNGSYEPQLKRLRAEQLRSGGRYVDRDTYDALRASYLRDAEQIAKQAKHEYDEAVRRLNKWKKTGKRADAVAFNEWVSRPEYGTAWDQYEKWWGKGRKSGKIQRLEASAAQISRTQDEFVTRQLALWLKTPTGRAYERAMEEQRKYTEGKDFAGPGSRDRMERAAPGKMTLREYNDWLDREYEKRLRIQREQFHTRNRMLNFEGFDTGNGRAKPSKNSPDGRVMTWLRKGAGDQDINKYIDLKTGSIKGATVVDQERNTRALVNMAMAGYDSEANAYNWGYSGVSGTVVDPKAKAVMEARRRNREKVLDQVWRSITGRGAPTGPDRVMYDLAGLPVSGEIIKGIGIAAGGVGSGLKLVQDLLGGRLETPDIQFDALFGSGKQFLTMPEHPLVPGGPLAGLLGLVGWDASQEQKQANAAGFNDFWQQWKAADGDLIKQLEIMSMTYGTDPVKGSLGQGLFNIFGDPTIALSVGKFLGAGRLAARQFAKGGAKGFLGEWYRLAGPQFTAARLRPFGAKPGAYIEAKNLDSLGKVLGRQLNDESDMLAARADIQKILDAPTEKEASELARLVLGERAPEREVRQLLSFIENMTADQAEQFGVLAVRAREYHALGQRVAAAELKSTADEALALATVKRIADEEATRVAVQPVLAARAQRVAAQTGVSVKAPEVASQVDQRILTKIEEVGRRQATLAREAKAAFDLADSITDVARGRERAAAFREATVKYQQWKEMQRKSMVRQGSNRIYDGPVDYMLGLLDEHIDKLPRGSRLSDAARQISHLDVRDMQHRMLVAKKAGNMAEFTQWKAAWEAAKKVRDRAKAHEKVVSDTVRQHGADARDFVRMNKVAAVVDSPEQAGEWAVRDLHARYEGSSDRPFALRSSDNAPGQVEQAQFSRYQQYIAPAGANAVDWSKLPDALKRRYADALHLFEKLTLDETLQVLVYLRGMNDERWIFWGDAWYDDLFEWIYHDLPPSLFTDPRTARVLTPVEFAVSLRKNWNSVADNATMDIGMDDILNLDATMSGALRASRGYAAQGTAPVTAANGVSSGGVRRPAATYDYELSDVVARIVAQRNTVLADMPLTMWDQLRGGFMPAILYRNASIGIREKAGRSLAGMNAKRASRGEVPLSLEEWQLQLMEARRAREGRLALAKFASRHPGMDPDEIWARFQLEQFGSLTEAGQPGGTMFQKHVYKKVFEDMVGLPPETFVKERFFKGTVALSPSQERMRAAPIYEVLADQPEFVGIPLYMIEQWDQAGRKRAYDVDAQGYTNREGMEIAYEPSDEVFITVYHEYWHGLEHSNPAVHRAVRALAADLDMALDNAGLGGIRGVLPQTYTDEFNNLVADLISKGKTPSDAADEAIEKIVGEVVSELYGIRRAAALGKPIHQLYDTFFNLPGASMKSDTHGAFLSISPEVATVVGKIDQLFDNVEGAGIMPDPAWFGISGMIDPPVQNARLFREWMVARGYWSPRDARLIAEGQMSWSYVDERSWLESRGFEIPDRLRDDVIKPALRDPEKYDELMRMSGVFGDEIDLAVLAHRIEPGKEGQRAVAFGINTKRGRSVDELRRYAAERYGPLVAKMDLSDPTKPVLETTANGDVILHDMPWLMTIDEFQKHVGRMAVDGLPPGIVEPERLGAVRDAINRAVRSRMKYWIDSGIIDRSEQWLPQERLAFTHQILDELLATGDPLGIFKKPSVRRRAINMIGVLNRLNIVTQIAFPVMNLVDAYGPKRMLLALHYKDFGMLPGGRVDQDAIDTIRRLEDIGRRKGGIYDLGESRMKVIREPGIRTSVKAQQFFRMLPEWGFELSSMGEDRLRLHMARRIYMAEKKALMDAGWTEDGARFAAKHGAAHEIQKIFPSLEDAGDFEKALNQIIPFFSYNARNKVLGLRLALENPYVMSVAGRIAAAVEQANRETWEIQHPGEPFPDGKGGLFWFEIDGQRWTIDFSTFSDWFRGPVDVFVKGGADLGDYVRKFLRVPHPQQEAMIAWVQNMIDGGDRQTPWGRPADASILWPVDLFEVWNSVGAGQTPLWIALSRTLFFARIGTVTVTDGRVAHWKALMDMGMRAEAREYMAAHPDVREWLELHRRDGYRLDLDGFSTSWFGQATPEERIALAEARRGLSDLDAQFDAMLAPYLNQPWSKEYRQIKRERRAAFLTWYRMHPELTAARAWGMEADEWASQLSDWAIDEDVDAYFGMLDARPNRDDYKTEAAYLASLAQYQDAVAAFLLANPHVADRLRGEEGSVRAVWWDQQMRWEEILRSQTDIRIAIAEEEAKEKDAQDPKFLSTLYDLQKDGYALLDQEAFAYKRDPSVLHNGTTVGRNRAQSVLDSVGGLLGRSTVVPGRADYFYAQASPDERVEIEEREAYFEKLDSYISRSKKGDGTLDGEKFGRFLDRDPAFAEQYYERNPSARRGREYYIAIQKVYNAGGKYGFYRELEKNPALMAEYFARNPEKLEKYRRYKAGVRYFEGITAIWQKAKTPEQFWELLEADPWLYKQYLSRNPSKAAAVAAGKRYWTFAKTYTDLLAAGKFADAQRYWLSMPAELRDRFYKSVGGSGGGNWAQGAQYVGYMGRWVEYFKNGDFDGARRYWDQLPQWVKERYVSKNPDKATKLLTPSQMSLLGEYFLLPSVGEREAFLRKHPDLSRWMSRYGGRDDVRRSAIMAGYSNLPKDPWLRRVYRERYPEIFSEEAKIEASRRKTARRLAEHPELAGRYYAFVERVMREFPHALAEPPPPPLTHDRMKASLRRRKERSRSAKWTSEHDERHGP